MRSILNLLIVTTLCLCVESCAKQKKDHAKYTDYERGYRFWYYDKWDSAIFMFNRYINNADDSLKKGQAYKYIGEIHWNIGDLYNAQQNLTSALNILDTNDINQRDEIGNTYNLLGNVSFDLHSYDKAIEFYDKALSLFNGVYVNSNTLNGKANALQKKGRLAEAIAIYDSTLTLHPSDQSIVARLIDNRAKTKWLQNRNAIVLPEFWLALKIRIDSQYNQGLGTSYSRLSDYYAKVNPDSALFYAEKMREISIANKNPDDLLEAIDKLIVLNSSPVLKEQWYEKFKQFNDSLQLSRNTSIDRFALIKFEVQKKRADDLVFQQHITRQRLWTYLSIGSGMVIIIILIVFFDKRRKRIKQESEIAIRDSKLKTSQKVHDVIANGLYGIMNELEHSDKIEADPLITKIEVLYEESRNISYDADILPGNSTDHDSEVYQLLTSFANEQTKMIIVGNGQAFWSRVTGLQRNELHLVLREIMINMKKHSAAENVAVIFRQENNTAFITYKDDGVGFASDPKFGNGLRNTVSRIKSLNGEINFGKSEKGGASIAISFPLQSNKI